MEEEAQSAGHDDDDGDDVRKQGTIATPLEYYNLGPSRPAVAARNGADVPGQVCLDQGAASDQSVILLQRRQVVGRMDAVGRRDPAWSCCRSR